MNTVAPLVIRESEVSVFSPNGALKVREMLNEKGFPFSVARVVVTGLNEESVNPHCDMAYFVLGGKGHLL
jgi:hypothetical protein